MTQALYAYMNNKTIKKKKIIQVLKIYIYIYILGSCVKNQMTVGMWVFAWVFYSIPLAIGL
jgi:uncharacterized integral membrane protein